MTSDPLEEVVLTNPYIPWVGSEMKTREVRAGELNPNTSWATVKTRKIYTNVFIWDTQKGRILLGYKKRGFGKAMYNGFGGKVEAGETAMQGAVRELKEESGIEAELEHAGTLLFTSSTSTMMHYIEIFRGSRYNGEVTETDEMRPEWFALPTEYRSVDKDKDALRDTTYNSIPFERMWADDKLWFDLLLTKQKFIGRVDFGDPIDPENLNSAPLLKWWFGEIL